MAIARSCDFLRAELYSGNNGYEVFFLNKLNVDITNYTLIKVAA